MGEQHHGLLTEIDHIGIAVRDLDAAIGFYAGLFGAELVQRERIESDGVDEALIRVAESYIQLVCPFREDSPAAKFIAKRGEGVHHVGYRVESCAEVLKLAQEMGYETVDKVPRPGSRDTTVAFIHPKAAFGTLIELVEE